MSSWISLLPKYFSDSLDRMTLWKRIRSGLRRAAQESPIGNLARFWTIISDHIKAKDGMTKDFTLVNTIKMFEKRPEEHRREWFRQCIEETDILIAYARESWETKKGAI